MKEINLPEETLKSRIIERLNNLTKPIGSLGFLEEIALKVGLIQGKIIPELPKDKRVFVFTADHGVSKKGVSAYPKEVTYQMVLNFLRGGAAINVFARHVGAEVYVVDAGVDGDFNIESKHLIKAKVGYGTMDFTEGPAMTQEQAQRCIEIGRKIAKEAIEDGADLLVVGDMGIGNTTTASAIAVSFGFDIEEILDIGTPIDRDGLIRKKEAITKGIEINKPDPKDPIDVLKKVGGFCIGQMTGFILEATDRKVPIVIDGFPTTVGLLLAWKINQNVTKYAFAGHKSGVKGHGLLLSILGLRPILDLGMRLGEGTGAVLSIAIIEAAIKMIREMATFDDAGVSKGTDRLQ
ncbi:MAG: nicotinate-nucleotide--dimethylbenzimidazole phosphoribosyltransferase [Synergistetes bacterium]|nr:nicotinate-nucleotide--dimethylbenzimidazole phosphoribosyltransferase [Synergistota bacterium]MCX8127225.1 nicotinate-nucleotide--dimethylbenzimidazole phosphoribosyltransferase [Synergistota bacterium]MDW8191889.1 nicotinate-nucleotide--dimethylbenzimidazole phosphoribosyltransferase [Synergistota bacterium]